MAKPSSKQIIERLEYSLLETGMMNQLFIDQIKTGQVNSKIVKSALSNFRKAMNPAPLKVPHRFVLGFLFSEDGSRVLLVWKNRPAWQNGKLNGVGGKIEPGETPLQAMKREFLEETYFVGYTNKSADPLFEDAIEPQWHLVGRRHRKAMFENQDESYEMFIYAAKIPDARMAVFSWAGANLEQGVMTEWCIPGVPDPRHEEVIALPMNREILARRGVPGLAWNVDISLQALRENFHIVVEDPPVHEDEE